MGIPAGATKISFSGVLAGGEIWNTGFWVVGPTLDATSAASCAHAIWDIFNQSTGTHAFAVLKAQYWSASTSWTAVNVYNYHDTSGVASVNGQYMGTPMAGSASNNTPDQIAVAVTLRTAFSGAHHRGRMYFPASGAGFDSNGLFNASTLLSLLNGLKADFASVEAESHLAGFDIGVLSRELGTATPVTALSADQRPDVQRRRANRQLRGSVQTVVL